MSNWKLLVNKIGILSLVQLSIIVTLCYFLFRNSELHRIDAQNSRNLASHQKRLNTIESLRKAGAYEGEAELSLLHHKEALIGLFLLASVLMIEICKFIINYKQHPRTPPK